MIDISRELQVALNTGKVTLGYRESLKAVIDGSAKLVIIASNAPADVMNTVQHYAKISNVPVYVFQGSSWDLGAAVRKPFKISTIAIIDPGESNILTLAAQRTG
ncbi:50S ribosomal protein L30e [Vulcanisaeta sp. JCM 16159]|uniref:50S ribosomal protein L30e n=1 Tax=Vulcanisaeta sp. JCM 16159 TaxID=1295371 RepID=UPI0006CF80F0|nr:50S ribosomal protein L30e [Vulcanisaeta sp. JCM 16159]